MLFLQAIALEAGAGIVLIGVAIGLTATLAGYLTIRLRRRGILDRPLTETTS